MMKNEVNPTDPSQVSYPWRAALRTGVQTLLAALAVLVSAAPIITEFIDKFWPGSPVGAWIVGAAALAGGVATVITRIMALESVNNLLTRLGLGATPK
jgi:hypothetical protein